MRKGIIVMIGAVAFLAGCGSQNKQASNIPAQPKWQGAPYHLAYGTPAAKPSAAGLTIPPIKYTANPEMLETRANLVVQFDTSGAKAAGPQMDHMIMAPVDISGTDGTLPADYVDAASKALSKMLGSYCMNGKVKIAVAITHSSLSLSASDDEVNAKRLSDWLPIELVFKNPHPKC